MVGNGEEAGKRMRAFILVSLVPKCTKNSIRIEYYENGGNAVCKLEWSGPLLSRQTVPTAQLFTAAGVIPITKEFVIYPNPTSTQSITVALNKPLQQGDKIVIYNMLGQLVKSKSISISSPGTKFTLPLNIANGVYLLQLVSHDKIYSAKFIVL